LRKENIVLKQQLENLQKIETKQQEIDEEENILSLDLNSNGILFKL